MYIDKNGKIAYKQDVLFTKGFPLTAVLALIRPFLTNREKTFLDIAMRGAPLNVEPFRERYHAFLVEVIRRRPFDFDPTVRELHEFERMWNELRFRGDSALAEAARISIHRVFHETRVDLIGTAKRDMRETFLELRDALGALALLWQIHCYPSANPTDPRANRVVTTVSAYRQLST